MSFPGIFSWLQEPPEGVFLHSMTLSCNVWGCFGAKLEPLLRRHREKSISQGFDHAHSANLYSFLGLCLSQSFLDRLGLV